MISILQSNERPGWVEYPSEYITLVNSDKDEFLPWYLLDKESLLIRYYGLQERYPKRNLFPFARADNSDDIACWEKEKPGKIILIHDFASSGYENKMEFETFQEWYNFVNNF